jgi:hypothetical protein
VSTARRFLIHQIDDKAYDREDRDGEKHPHIEGGDNMTHGRKVSEEMVVLLKRLVMNGQLQMAKLVLHTYFRRVWKEEEQLAGYYVQKYLEKYFPKQYKKYINGKNSLVG